MRSFNVNFPIDQWEFKSQSILKDLPEDELKMLMEYQSVHVYEKGDMVFREGAVPDGIFYIRKGKVKKYKVDKDGRGQIIYVANTGELIGYHAVLAQSRYPDSAAALEQSTIVFIPKADFEKVLQISEVFGTRLLKTLSHEFAVLINSLTIQSLKSVRERLALHLVILHEKYKDNDERKSPVEIDMAREDLANLVGTARENIVRLLTEFKESGILTTRGRSIFVLDVKRLITISNY